jgi:hypothetical protein
MGRGVAAGRRPVKREAIEAFIQKHNERAKPFRWRKREVREPIRNTIVNLRERLLPKPQGG